MRIRTFAEFQELLQNPVRAACWRDPALREAPPVYLRGYTLGDRLAWKDSWLACDDTTPLADTPTWVYSPEAFTARIVIGCAFEDSALTRRVFPDEAKVAAVRQSWPDHAPPPGIVAQWAQWAHVAAGVVGINPVAVFDDPAPAAGGGRWTVYWQHYGGRGWYSRIMPALPDAPDGTAHTPDLWEQAVFHVRGRTLAESFQEKTALRPVDGGIDADFGLPELLWSVLLNADGTALVPEDPESRQFVLDRLPYGAAKALELASLLASGFAAGEADFFTGN